MEKPLITIITITYNAGKVLEKTVDSILTQTYKNYEHLVIDGASTDDTLKKARKNPDARIISEKDRGLYDAMNKGLKYAKGEYVIFLNAGDTFRTSDTLAQYAAATVSSPDIIYADTMVVNEKGEDIAPRHHSAPALLTFESFSKGMLVCHQAFMVRKRIAPNYDLAYKFSADYDWTIKCIKNTDPEKCVNLNTYAINYLSDGLTDKNKIKSLKERYKIMSTHYGALKTFYHHVNLIFRHLSN